MPKKHRNDLFFDKKLRNKYHIRKFSAGIASVLFGTLVYVSLDQQAQAAEAPASDTSTVNDTNHPQAPSSTASAEQPLNTQTSTATTAPTESVSDSTKTADSTIQQPSTDNQTSQVDTKPEPVSAPQPQASTDTVKTETAAPTANETTTAPEVSTNTDAAPKTEETNNTAPQTETAPAPETATRAMTASSPAPEAPITNTSAPAPAANAHPVDNVEGVTEQVYSKSIPVYPKSDVAKTAKMQRGIYQARESLGLIVPAGKEFYIRQAQGSNEADLRVDLMTNDRLQVRNKTVSRDGSWTNISTGIDSAAFVRIPTGLNQQPVVEYYVQDNAGVTLPTYRKNGDKAAFDSDWAARDTSYGYVDGDKIAFLVPREDRERIANLGQDPGRWGFTDLDDMIGYYEDVINHYDKWVGLNDDINSVHYNVGQKYFTIADAHGPGLAYYSTNNMGSNNTSMSGYLEKGWLGLHEVGHGYDGAMTYDHKMDLIEVENNILANQYQTEVMGVNDGWLYEGNQEGVQKGFNDRLVTGDLSYANGGFRGRLDFMTKMVRLTGIEGFTDLWKGIRQEEADMANASKPFAQDVPRWINTYWLADNGINGTAYFDLYKINLPQTLKDQLDTYNNTYTYPLSLLINNPEEQQRLTQKLGLSTPYELVKSSDLADTSVRADAEVSLNLNGQTLPDNVKVSLMEGTQEVASAEVVDGKAVFPQVRAGVYKIVAPLSTTYALPESEYIVVKESGENQAVLNYPKNDDVQDSVTQTISLRGLSNFEFASANYNPDTKQIEFKQNAGQPHVYFTDEYAHMTIQKADGTNVLDKSYIGNQRLSSETQTFDLDYGDKVIVHHREPAARRVLVRNETKENVTVPLADQETVTYTLTDKGFIVDGETQTDANRRYDEAIQSDVAQVAAAIQAHPERDYRSQLFKVFQGVEYADPNIKAELMNILNPLVEAYRVDTPVVNPIEAGSTSISGTGEAGSTITVTFKNGQKAEVEVPENGQWTTQLPQGTTVEHNDVTQVFATGKHGTVSETVSVKALDTIAPTVPTINNVEAGTNTVTGKAEPSSTVKLTLADGSTKEVVTDAQGNWTAEFSAPFAYQAPIKAVSTDKAGNQSTEATKVVEDTTAPQAPVINKVEAGANTVTGTAEPSSTVTLTLADGATKEVVTDAQGNWTAEFNAPFVYQAPIKAVSTDKAGNHSTEATQTVVDTTAPQTPVINKVEAGTNTVSGTAEPSSTVTLTLADGSTKEVVADSQGNWTAEFDTPFAYQAPIKAVSTDKAGNASQEATKVVEDTTAPQAPVINKVEAGTNTVSGTAEPSSTVKITLADGSTKEVQADIQGNWTAEFSAPFAYQAPIKAVSTDKAGNHSTEATQTVVDTTAPQVPVINKVETGANTVTGIAEPSSTVTLTLADGTTKEVVADSQGNWIAEFGTPFAYQASIKAVSTDKAGNHSTETTQTVVDTTAPQTPVINKVEAGASTVTGTAEPSSTVKLTLADGSTKEVATYAQGNWTAEFDTPFAYQAPIKAVSTDKAGNHSTEATQTVVDTTAPQTPVINKVEAGTNTVSGTAEPSSTVTLTLADGATKEVVTDAQGNWTAEFNAPFVYQAPIKAVSTDKAGNHSTEATQTVVDTTAPQTPVINKVEAGTNTVSGTAEPSSTVTLTLADGATKEVVTDAQGNWTAEFNAPFVYQAPIKAVSTDKAGNHSTEATQTVVDTTAPQVPVINKVEAGTSSVSGTAEPSSTVKLTLADGSTKEVVTDAQGNWTAEFSAPFAYQAPIKAVSTDKAGNASQEATQVVADTTAPQTPVINKVEAGTNTVSGTAEPSSTVTLTLADGSTKEVVTDAQGNWTAEFDTPFVYQTPIKAVSTDKAGNASQEATQVVEDTTAPQTPVINKVEAGTNTVSGTAEPSSTVKLTLADGSTKEVVTDAQGNWTAEFDTPFAYQAPIKAVSTDKAGNASQEATKVVEDTTAPQAPVVNEVKATDSSVSGTSEANALVTVVLADGKRFEARADAEGKWTVALTQDVALKGNEVITVTAKDSADNQSAAAESKVVPVEVKTEEPAGQPNTPSETEVPQDETDEVASETPDTTETAQPEENTESESSEKQPVETAPVDQNETPESDNSASNDEESTCDSTPAPDSETSDNTGENAPDTPVDSNQNSTPATEPMDTNTEVSVENEVCEVPSEESEESVEDASTEAVENNTTTEQPAVEEPAPVTSESPVDVTEETSVATDNKVQEDVVNENEVAESETVQPDSNHQQAQEAEQSKVSETVEAVETTSTPSSSTSSPVTDEDKGSDQTESHSSVAKSKTVSETPKDSVLHVTKEKIDQQQTVQGQKVQDKQQTKNQDKVLPATGQQEQSSSSIGWIASLFGAALIGRFARKKAKEDK